MQFGADIMSRTVIADEGSTVKLCAAERFKAITDGIAFFRIADFAKSRRRCAVQTNLLSVTIMIMHTPCFARADECTVVFDLAGNGGRLSAKPLSDIPKTGTDRQQMFNQAAL